ncbi:hypothetical protein BJV82DRAFT_607218, partial [Fennellomyces sp. T-0311]
MYLLLTSLTLSLVTFITHCHASVNSTSIHHRLWSRQNEYDITVCSLSAHGGTSPLTDIYRHFNGIILRDTSIEGDQSIAGPFATGSVLHAMLPNTAISIGHNSEYAKDGIYRYGLVTGYDIVAEGTISAHGNILYGQNEPENELQTQGDRYEIRAGTDGMDFETTKAGLLVASEYLAKLRPNLKMDASGAVQHLSEPEHNEYHVLTLNTCVSSPSCSSWSQDLLSNATGIFYNGSEWSGPSDPAFQDGRTIVINVPVTLDHPMVIRTKNPSAQLPSCRTIF